MNHPAVVVNRLANLHHRRKQGPRAVTCREFLDRCYGLFTAASDPINYIDVANQQFDKALDLWQATKPAKKAINPY